jgi:CheY-like chemotaxis protein
LREDSLDIFAGSVLVRGLLGQRKGRIFKIEVNLSVLLVDSDLGFVLWLGRTLAEVGYEVLPAKSVPDALTLIAELQPTVALLILRDSLPGAADLIAILRYAWKDLKVILSVEDVDERLRLNADAQYRTGQIDENSRTRWLHAIERVLWEGVTVSAPAQGS